MRERVARPAQLATASGRPARRPQSPRSLLNVQKRIGNRATTALLQRRIGFEIETAIPYTYSTDDYHFYDPGHDFETTVFGASALKADHIPGHDKTELEVFEDWPIVEFVSESLDQKVTTFKTQAKSWLTLLGELRAKAQKTPPVYRLSKTVKGADDNAYIGFPGKQRVDSLDRISVQSTIGLRLDRVSEFVDAWLAAMDPHAGAYSKSRALAATEATTDIDAVLNALPAQYAPTSDAERAELPAIRGLLLLVAQYLEAGRTIKSGYGKNRPFTFPKSELSDVRNALAQPGTFALRLFGKYPRQWLTIRLLAEARRDTGEGVLGAGTPACWDWVEEVLSGTDDKLFKAIKNRWSTKLGPETVGGATAAVAELRWLREIMPEAENLSLADPDKVVDFLQAIFTANQAWQDLP